MERTASPSLQLRAAVNAHFCFLTVRSLDGLLLLAADESTEGLSPAELNRRALDHANAEDYTRARELVHLAFVRAKRALRRAEDEQEDLEQGISLPEELDEVKDEIERHSSACAEYLNNESVTYIRLGNWDRART